MASSRLLGELAKPQGPWGSLALDLAALVAVIVNLDVFNYIQ